MQAGTLPSQQAIGKGGIGVRVMISADMEGATGVTHPSDVTLGTEQFQRFRRMLLGDVNAAIAGLFAGGVNQVLVNEAHSGQRNLPLEDLDPRAEMITGRYKPLAMMEGVADADAVAFVGYHDAAGGNGVLAHTWTSQSVIGVWINGEVASEGRMNALLAAEYGVPVVLVTGDDLACADAGRYAPDARAVPVKTAISRFTARCRPPSATATAIEDAAREAARQVGRLDPVQAGPYTYEVEFDAAQIPPMCTGIPTVEQTADRRVAFTLPTMYEALRCFRVVMSIAGGSAETWN